MFMTIQAGTRSIMNNIKCGWLADLAHFELDNAALDMEIKR